MADVQIQGPLDVYGNISTSSIVNGAVGVENYNNAPLRVSVEQPAYAIPYSLQGTFHIESRKDLLILRSDKHDIMHILNMSDITHIEVNCRSITLYNNNRSTMHQIAIPTGTAEDIIDIIEGTKTGENLSTTNKLSTTDDTTAEDEL